VAAERGLVLSPGLEFRNVNDQRGRLARNEWVCLCEACLRQLPISPQELRTYLLFWDKLDYPGHREGLLMHNEEQLFLIEAGIMERTKIQGFPPDPTMVFSEIQMTAFRVQEEREPGVWSYGRHDGRRSLIEYDSDHRRGLLACLIDCIPVPDKEIPLQHILEFKEKRRDELLALRHHLDGVYQRIVSAGDGPLALSTELSLLQQAIINHTRTAKEHRLALRLGSLEAVLKIEVDLGRASTVGAFAYTAGLNGLAAMLAGAIAGASPKLEVRSSAAVKSELGRSTPFEYITSYQQELFP
jgi:uncharacterized protein DUF6236